MSIHQAKQLQHSKLRTSHKTLTKRKKVAFELDYLNDKKARYESHYQFITRCQREKIVPDGLKVYLEPSISNHSEEFLNWNDRLQSFSLTVTNILREKNRNRITQN